MNLICIPYWVDKLLTKYDISISQIEDPEVLHTYMSKMDMHEFAMCQSLFLNVLSNRFKVLCSDLGIQVTMPFNGDGYNVPDVDLTNALTNNQKEVSWIDRLFSGSEIDYMDSPTHKSFDVSYQPMIKGGSIVVRCCAKPSNEHHLEDIRPSLYKTLYETTQSISTLAGTKSFTNFVSFLN